MTRCVVVCLSGMFLIHRFSQLLTVCNQDFNYTAGTSAELVETCSLSQTHSQRDNSETRSFTARLATKYSRTVLIRINWDGEPSGYTEHPNN
jgi:hypothetical protein